MMRGIWQSGLSSDTQKGGATMAEQLLNAKQAAARLGISVRSLHRYRAKLCALGMQIVRLGQRVTYRESSIDRIIRMAAERDESLYEADIRS